MQTRVGMNIYPIDRDKLKACLSKNKFTRNRGNSQISILLGYNDSGTFTRAMNRGTITKRMRDSLESLGIKYEWYCSDELVDTGNVMIPAEWELLEKIVYNATRRAIKDAFEE